MILPELDYEMKSISPKIAETEMESELRSNYSWRTTWEPDTLLETPSHDEHAMMAMATPGTMLEIIHVLDLICDLNVDFQDEVYH